MQELREASSGGAGGEAAAGRKLTLLQDLLCAAMHSRAAYGYAMAAGHLSSLLNFALLQTVRFCSSFDSRTHPMLTAHGQPGALMHPPAAALPR